jgi:hypothetical protein
MRITMQTLSPIPKVAGVYGMYGGRGRSHHLAYVGIADSLKTRIAQHLVKRDSSVATGTTAACLNPDYVTEVVWWCHEDFANRDKLGAAEHIAFGLLNPALRSRGKVTESAKIWANDNKFQNAMYHLFTHPPTDKLVLPSLHVLQRRLEALERRVVKLEKVLQRRSIDSA